MRHSRFAATPLILAALLATSCGEQEAGPTLSGEDRTSPSESIAAAKVTDNGQKITVTQGTSPCTTLKLAADESSDAVRLSLAASPQTGVCAQTIVAESAQVTLEQPLSQRKLVDALTDKPIPYFDESALAIIASLPPGYTQSGDFLSVLTPHGNQAQPVVAWVRSFGATPHASATIRISQAQSEVELVDIPRTGSTRVGTSQAAVHRAEGRLALTWTTPDHRAFAVESFAAQQSEVNSIADLRDIASGIKIP